MAAPLCWAAIIFIAYSIPGQDLNQFESWDILKLDKLIHFTLFAGFSFLLVNAFINQRGYRFFHKNARVIAVILSIVYGGVLEFVQGRFFEGRSSDIMDFVANCIGAFGGLLIYKIICGRRFNHLQ
jgi:VanZ family protein